MYKRAETRPGGQEEQVAWPAGITGHTKLPRGVGYGWRPVAPAPVLFITPLPGEGHRQFMEREGLAIESNICRRFPGKEWWVCVQTLQGTASLPSREASGRPHMPHAGCAQTV